jgi:transcriptional regulator with XRE-family HTH domain
VSQEQLAHQLGVSSRTVQNWERGGTITAPEPLARALNTTVGYIMTGEHAPSEQDGAASDLVDRLSRQQEILRRVAENRLLTAGQLEFLERALDDLERGLPPVEAESHGEEADEAA